MEGKKLLKLSQEERLLLRCASQGCASDAGEVARLTAGRSFSWDRAMMLAHWHRMPGMLYAFLRKPAESAVNVPESDMAHLRDHYRHNAVRNLFIGSEFARLARALHARDIDLMPLKGIALLGSVYRDPGTRYMADIDLLVRPSEAVRAQEAVLGMGYEAVGTDAVRVRTQEVHRHLPKLVHRQRRLAVEIHTHFVSLESPLRFEISSVWQHSRMQELHGVKAPVPAPEHMLLHLCVHFFLDRRFTSLASLRQLGDVAAVIGCSERAVDWDFFVQEVRRHGLTGPAYSVLSVASVLMDVNVPAQALDALRPAGYSRKMEESFIQQRVLKPGELTATELVPHQSEYTLGALARSVYRRVAPDRRYLETHYGEEAVNAPGRARARRLGEAASRVLGL
jgi:hypothetical protein